MSDINEQTSTENVGGTGTIDTPGTLNHPHPGNENGTLNPCREFVVADNTNEKLTQNLTMAPLKVCKCGNPRRKAGEKLGGNCVECHREYQRPYMKRWRSLRSSAGVRVAEDENIRRAAKSFFESFSKGELNDMADAAERAVIGSRENPYPPSEFNQDEPLA